MRKFIVPLVLLISTITSCTANNAQLPPSDQNPTNSIQTQQYPASPTELSGQILSITAVSLVWKVNSINETGFNVYRDGKVIVTLPAKSNNYQDSGLVAGTTYNYIIRAINNVGESGPATLTITIPTPVPPISPSNLIGQAPSSTKVSLQWNDNSKDEDGFRIYRDNVLIGSVGSNINAFLVTGLSPGKTYLFTVKAYNTNGESGVSTCVAKTPNPPLTITLDYVVVTDNKANLLSNYNGTTFVILFSDGTYYTYPTTGAINCEDYITQTIGKTIWHTETANDNISAAILVISQYSPSLLDTLLKQLVSAYNPTAGSVFTLLESIITTNGDQLVGYYNFDPLNSTNSWGIGKQFNGVGIGDLKLWLSIWSEQQPSPISLPTVNPDVTFDRITIPDQVSIGSAYTTAVVLKNNEDHAIDVTVSASSSTTGSSTFSQPVHIDKHSTSTVSYSSHCDTVGPRTITLSLTVAGRVFQSTSRTLYASGPLSVVSCSFNPNPITHGNTSSLTLTLNGGNSGTYTINFLKDVALFPDTLVSTSTFQYNGILGTFNFNLTPSQPGSYHIDLVSNGVTLWGQPTGSTRLTVS